MTWPDPTWSDLDESTSVTGGSNHGFTWNVINNPSQVNAQSVKVPDVLACYRMINPIEFQRVDYMESSLRSRQAFRKVIRSRWMPQSFGSCMQQEADTHITGHYWKNRQLWSWDLKWPATERHIREPGDKRTAYRPGRKIRSHYEHWQICIFRLLLWMHVYLYMYIHTFMYIWVQFNECIFKRRLISGLDAVHKFASSRNFRATGMKNIVFKNVIVYAYAY